jgi:multiple sugar transport system substrate-binding protein
MGFKVDDKKLKRAGLDYWHLLDITYYKDTADFFEKNKDGNFFYFSTKATHRHTDVTYPDNTSEPMDLIVLPLPKTGDGTQYMPITGVGMSAFKSDDERKAEAAAVFLRWFTESQRNLDFVVETGYMPVRSDAFASINNYAFPTKGYASLYETIKVMLENYEPVVRPDFDGFYKRVTALYDGLRLIQPDLVARAANGEDVGALAEEVWDFCCLQRVWDFAPVFW